MSEEEHNKNKQKKYTVYYIVLAVALIAVIAILAVLLINKNKNKDDKIIAYTDLIEQVDENNIEKIEMKVGWLLKRRRRKNFNCAKYTSFCRVNSRKKVSRK